MMGTPGFLKSVFDIFAANRLSVDLVSTSEVNLSLTLDPISDSQSLQCALEQLKDVAQVVVSRDRAMVAVVGAGLKKTAGLASQIFGELKDINIQLISMGASELNISFVVATSDCDEVVRRLHRRLISSSETA